MRILLANKYYREVGGVEVHMFAVKKLLEDLGHEVVPFAMQETDSLPSEYSPYWPSEVDLRGSGGRGRLRGLERATISSESKRKLQNLVSQVRIDAAYVIHVYHQIGMSILGVLKDNQIPSVLSLHDYKIGCGNYRFFSERTGEICTRCMDHRTGFLWAPIVERCWDSNAAAGAALTLEAASTRVQASYAQASVITTLNSLQEATVARSAPTVPRLRVPHPVTLHPSSDPSRRGGVLYVGRLVPEKGVATLIDACGLAGLPLRLIGGGRSEGELREKARQYGDRIEFLGARSHSDTLEAMKASEILAVPSAWHEVSPFVVYEAIAHDLPVVASNVGGMVDQLGDGRGWLVDDFKSASAWADVLASVTRDPDLGRERSRRAREYAAVHWSPQSWRDNMEKAFALAGVSIVPGES